MICRNCGKTINDTATFCGYCKAIVKPEQIKFQKEQAARNQAVQQQPVFQPPMPVPPQEEKVSFYKKWWFWTAVALIVILLIGILFFVLNGKSDKEKKSDKKDSEATQAVSVTDSPTDAATEPATELIHDGSFDSFDDGYNYDDDDDYNYVNINLNEETVVANLVSFTFVDAGFYEDFTAELPDIQGETYIILAAAVTNLSRSEIESTNFHAEFIVNDTYTYGDEYAEVYRLDDSTGTVYTYGTLYPDNTSYACFVCSVPDEVYNECSTLNFVFGFDEEFSYNPTYYGKDSCDYIYSLYLHAQ